MSGDPLGLEAVRITLDGRTIVPRIDLSVAPGTVATIMGPSGAGKSTLLSFVAGVAEAPFRCEGRVRIGGDDVTAVPPHRRRIAMLFQDDLLFAHLSVAGNLLFGLRRGRDGRRARCAVVEAALAAAGLGGLGDRDPASLSGGQRARVGVLRVLLSDPRALLLDEPFGRLDAPLRASFREFVLETVRARGLPTLLVTHDPADADAAGGPVIRPWDDTP
jgi:putative thiamine transport system ATP-binding protein